MDSKAKFERNLKGNKFIKEDEASKYKQILHKERELSVEKSKAQAVRLDLSDMASGKSVHDFEDEKMQKFFMTFLQAVGNFQVQLEEEKQNFLAANMEKMKKMEERVKDLEFENDSLRKANHNLSEQLDSIREENKESSVDHTNSIHSMKKELEEITITMQSLQAEQAKERMKYYSLKEQLEAAKQTISQQKSEIEKLRRNTTDSDTPQSIDYTAFLKKSSENAPSTSVAKPETPKPPHIPRSKTPSPSQLKTSSNIARSGSAKSLAMYGKQASMDSLMPKEESSEEEKKEKDPARKRRNSLLQKLFPSK